MAANLLPDEAQVATANSKPVAFLAVASLIIAGLFATLYFTSNTKSENKCAETNQQLNALNNKFLEYVIKTEKEKVDLISTLKKNTDSAIREAVNKNPNIK